MKITKRNFNVIVKLTKDFDSVAFSEGFEFEINGEDKKRIDKEFEEQKRLTSQRVYASAKDFLSGMSFEKKTGKEHLKNGKLDISLDFKNGDEV